MRLKSVILHFVLTILPSFIICNCVFLGCNNRQVQNESFQTKSLYLNLDDTTSILASDIFDKVEYIPLEAKRESLIGEISKIEITADLFFIMDKVTNSLIIFNHAGDYIRKISSVTKIDDTTFIKLTDFTIDKLNKEIVVLDSYLQRVVRFSFLGKKLGERPVLLPIYNLFIMKTYTYVYKNYAKENTPIGFNLIVLDNSGRELRRYLKYDPVEHTREDLLAGYQNFYRSWDKAYFSQPFSNVIYEIEENGLVKPVFKVDFPDKYQMPKDFLTNNKFNQKRKSFFMDKEGERYKPVAKHKTLIWNCTDVFITHDSIIAMSLVSMDNLFRCVLYDCKNNKVFNFENIYSDSSVNSLPIIEKGIIGSDGQNFYGQLSPKLMVFAKLHIPNNNSLANKRLSEYLSNVSTMSNPVITKIAMHSPLKKTICQN